MCVVSLTIIFVKPENKLKRYILMVPPSPYTDNDLHKFRREENVGSSGRRVSAVDEVHENDGGSGVWSDAKRCKILVRDSEGNRTDKRNLR